MKKLRFVVSFLIAAYISLTGLTGSFASDMILKYGEVSISDSYQESYETRGKGSKKSLSLAEKKILDAIKNLDSQVDISEYGINTSVQRELLDKIIRENPDIFYTRGWTYSYSPSSGTVFGIMPDYDYEKSKIESMKAEIEQKLSAAIEKIKEPDMTPLEKVLAVHQYLVLNIEYDERGNAPIESHSIYGALVDGKAVCEGYSELLTVMLERLGEVDSFVVVSEEMLHAWNMVVLDGNYYHIDATWNDPTPDREGYVRYEYLLIPDSVMASDHQWDRGNYPVAESSDYSFLWKLENPRYSSGVIRHWSKDTGRFEEILLERPDVLEEEEDIDLPDNIEPVGNTARPYITGYDDGTFRPENSVKRLEIASMIFKLLELSERDAKFPDVSHSSWAFGYIGAMQNSGYMKGDQAGRFNPEASLTRSEMATIAAAIYQGEHSGQDLKFKDISGHWGEKAITDMAKAGVVKGYSDGSFAPNKEVSRAEAVAILNRLSKLTISDEELKSAINPFSDVRESHWAYRDILKATKNR
ncbi:cellulosome-anchoring protein precursor [Andreesenia angusta]|uniref:Cellulosome-anchoring protein n=1 Tax=Andreesenia angusta TaxID=39480 RepID=A0A1S1V5C7_9FIRM|nr:S-layer homology domain-containing protein [Andreesenia angusta]OHW61866.1 cellulosome-anchoring protein precursor [Andreesenia angusta]